MRSKMGEVGVGAAIGMIPKMIILCIIALGVFSFSVLFYEYYVDVRDAEARILAREMTECLAGDGVLNLDDMSEEDMDEIMVYCGFFAIYGRDGSSNLDRFYIGVDVFDESGQRVEKLEQGDSGALWIKDLFQGTGRVIDKFDKGDGGIIETGSVIVGNAVETVENIVKYNPGYFVQEYPVFVVKDEVLIRGKIEMEVLVNYDED